MTVLDALPAHIALLDSHGTIVAVNQAWRRFADENGFQGAGYGVGTNYLDVCDRAQGNEAAGARELATAIRAVLSGTTHDYTTEYACHSATEQRWFRLTVTPLADEDQAGAVAVHNEVTERRRIEVEVQTHAARLARMVEAQQQLAAGDDSLEQLMDRIPALAQRITGADGAVFEVIEDDALVYRAGSGMAAGHASHRLKMDSSLSGQALRLQQTLCCDDADTDPRVDRAACRGLGLRSMVVSVLCSEDKPIGVIKVIARNVFHFSAADTASLELLNEVLGSVLRRKRAEEALRARESMLANAQRVAPLGTFELDVLNNYLVWSDETYRIFGVTPERFDNTHEAFLALLHPDDARRLAPVYANPPRDGSPAEVEYRIIRPDGQIRVISERGEVTFDADGKPLRKIGVAMDVTGARRMERALRESEQRYKSLFEQNPDGVCSFDVEGRITSVNQAFEQLSGYRWEEARSMSFHALVTPPHLVQAETSFRKALSGVAVNYEITGIAEDGRQRQIDVTNLPIIVDDEIIGVFGIARDITERRVTEARLRETQELLRIAGRMAQLGAWAVDLIEKRVIWSDEMCAIHEVPANTAPAIGSILDHYAPEWRETLRQVFDACIRDGTPFDQEAELITALGRRIWVRIISEAVRDTSGEVIRVQGALQDITVRKKSEARVRRIAERLTTTLESITDAFLTLDREWHFTYLNPQAEHMLERSRDHLLGKKLWEAFPEGKNSVFDDQYRRALSENQAVDFEAFFPPRALWLEVRAYPSEKGLAIHMRDVTDRHQAAEERDAFYKERMLLLDSTGEGIYGIDKNGHCTFINRAAARWLGYSADAVLGQHMHALIHARRADGSPYPQAQCPVCRTLTDGQACRQDDEVFWRRDGTAIPVEYNSYPIVDEGEITGAVITFSDITERKNAEADGRRAADEQASIIQIQQELANANAGVQALMDLGTDRARSLAHANGAIVELVEGERVTYRAASGSVVGRAGLRWERPGSLLGQALRSGQVLLCRDAEADNRVDHAECRRLGARSMIAVPFQAEGKSIGALKVLSDRPDAFTQRDVNNLQILVEALGATLQRIRAAERLRASEAQYRLLFERNPHPMWVYDPRDLHFLAVNDAAVRHYGYSRDEFLTMTIRDIRPSEGMEQLDNLVSSQDSDERRLMLAQHKKKDGTIIDVEVSSNGMMVAGDWVRLVLAHDVTDRLSLQRQLQQAHRLEAIGQLTGGVAHDFNNLLTVILGNAELLAEQLEDRPEVWQLADMTRAAAQRGADLTHRLLAFARRQTLAPKAVAINELVTGMGKLLQRTLTADIDIRHSLDPGLWLAQVDMAQLESALLNLCLNARDAMPNGGHLTIETANIKFDQGYADQHAEVQPGEYVMVSVSDTGTGIAPEILDKVFDPFFTTKEKGKGTGLGLSMVYGFAKQSGGHLAIYSELNHGTVVNLYLPRAESEGHSAHDTTLPESAPRGSEKILLVEDNDLVRRYAEGLLVGLGYRVITATNGPQALDMLPQHPDIDLLFTDIMMPGGMNGHELVEEARRLLPGLKVLRASGYTENTIIHDSGLESDTPFLHKPYRRFELARTLRAVLSGSRGEHE